MNFVKFNDYIKYLIKIFEKNYKKFDTQKLLILFVRILSAPIDLTPYLNNIAQCLPVIASYQLN